MREAGDMAESKDRYSAHAIATGVPQSGVDRLT
jgi:hypothetical protein